MIVQKGNLIQRQEINDKITRSKKRTFGFEMFLNSSTFQFAENSPCVSFGFIKSADY